MAANQTIINSLISGDISGLNIIVIGAGITLLTAIFRAIKNSGQSKKIDWFEVCRVLLVAMGFGFILVIRFDKDLSLSNLYFKFVFTPVIICFLFFYFSKKVFPLMKIGIEPTEYTYPWMVKYGNIVVRVMFFGYGLVLLLMVLQLLQNLARIPLGL